MSVVLHRLTILTDTMWACERSSVLRARKTTPLPVNLGISTRARATGSKAAALNWMMPANRKTSFFLLWARRPICLKSPRLKVQTQFFKMKLTFKEENTWSHRRRCPRLRQGEGAQTSDGSRTDGLHVRWCMSWQEPQAGSALRQSRSSPQQRVWRKQRAHLWRRVGRRSWSSWNSWKQWTQIGDVESYVSCSGRNRRRRSVACCRHENAPQNQTSTTAQFLRTVGHIGCSFQQRRWSFCSLGSIRNGLESSHVFFSSTFTLSGRLSASYVPRFYPKGPSVSIDWRARLFISWS